MTHKDIYIFNFMFRLFYFRFIIYIFLFHYNPISLFSVAIPFMVYLCIIHFPTDGHLYSEYFAIVISNVINLSLHMSLPTFIITALILKFLKLLKVEFPSQRDFKGLNIHVAKGFPENGNN